MFLIVSHCINNINLDFSLFLNESPRHRPRLMGPVVKPRDSEKATGFENEIQKT